MKRSKLYLIVTFTTVTIFFIISLCGHKKMCKTPPTQAQLQTQTSYLLKRGKFFVTGSSIKKPYKRNIIILTNRRSGSSFVGQLFNQNPNVVYFFEPLLAFVRGNSPEEKETSYLQLQGNVSNYVSDIFACNFSRIKRYLVFLKLAKGWQTKERGIVISRTLKRCRPTKRTVSSSCVKAFENLCLFCRYKVIKTIRIDDVDSLAALRDDLTVLHLLRDPRGIIASRIRELEAKDSPFKNQEKIASYVHNESKKLCYRMYHNLVKAPDVGFLQYMQIRYEDVALNSQYFSEMIYSHIQMPYHHKVRQWINTAQYSNRDKGFNFQSQNQSLYSTLKVSGNVAFKWRHNLPWNLVEIIQNNCDGVMKIAGYLRLNNLQQLERKDISTMQPIHF